MRAGYVAILAHHVLCFHNQKLAPGRREAVRVRHEELAKIGRKSVQLLQQQQADGATGVVTMLGLEGEGTEEPRIVFEPAPLIEAPIDRATLASSPATGPPPRMMYSLFKSQAASSSASSSSAVMLRPEAGRRVRRRCHAQA